MRVRMTYMIAVLVAVLLALSSCEDSWETRRPDRVSVSFLAVGQGTKSAVAAHEGDVRTLDVLAYDASTGRASAGGHSEGSAVTMEVTKGATLTFFVVANAPDGAFAGCGTVSAFMSRLSLLEHGSSSSLVMVSASETRTFTESADVSVELSRLCSKVVLEGFTPVLWGADELAGASIVFDRAYLINVVGSCPLSMSPSVGSVWYNRSVYDGSLDALLQDYLCSVSGTAVTSAAKVDTGYSFYCMPNPTDNAVNFATEPTWSPRNTRLVLEFTVDGVKTYYPIDIPAMKCNMCYVIKNLTITRMGSHHPDIPVGKDTVQFTVEVTPWGENDINEILQ